MVRIAAALVTLSLLFCILSLGCVTSQEAKPSVTSTTLVTTVTTAQIPLKEAISVSVTEPIRYYTTGGGCEYETTFEIRNTVSSPQQNVMVRLNLVDKGDGSVDDLKNQLVERINGNESKRFTVKLHGECGAEYQVQAFVL